MITRLSERLDKGNGVLLRLGKSRAEHKTQTPMEGKVMSAITHEPHATQHAPIPRALTEGDSLDTGVKNAAEQIRILRRKNLLANQTIRLLAAENRELKMALREGVRTAA